ncbi:hypothetical protein ACFYXH_11950 [Streptomyces sp. NPDC002730]|uniref:hypothetical protein n=1 Tax=unclassified Streptomyces TaxID=2593676 RepID=UPI002E0F561C|nr:hypothetical protein OG735_03790 [Streptomyces sp. NBC_01210]
MTDRRPEGPEETGTDPDTQVPKDLPDQQAHDGDDPLDLPRPDAPDDGTPDPDPGLPDVDQTGAGPRGSPRSGSVHPEQPVPDEPSG